MNNSRYVGPFSASFAFTHRFPRVVIAVHVHHRHNVEIHVPQKTGVQLFLPVELGYLHVKPGVFSVSCQVLLSLAVVLNEFSSSLPKKWFDSF